MVFLPCYSFLKWGLPHESPNILASNVSNDFKAAENPPFSHRTRQDNKILYYRLAGKHIYHVCIYYVLGRALNLKHKIYSPPCFIYFSWHSKIPNCQCLNQTVQSENLSNKWFWINVFRSKFVVGLYYSQSTVDN